MKHEILWDRGEIDRNMELYKTTHPRVTYDILRDKFIADLGQGSYAEVYGLNKLKRAIQLADINWEEIDE